LQTGSSYVIIEMLAYVVMPTALHHSMMTVADLLSLRPEKALPELSLRRHCLSLTAIGLVIPQVRYYSQPHLCL